MLLPQKWFVSHLLIREVSSSRSCCSSSTSSLCVYTDWHLTCLRIKRVFRWKRVCGQECCDPQLEEIQRKQRTLQGSYNATLKIQKNFNILPRHLIVYKGSFRLVTIGCKNSLGAFGIFRSFFYTVVHQGRSRFAAYSEHALKEAKGTGKGKQFLVPKK